MSARYNIICIMLYLEFQQLIKYKEYMKEESHMALMERRKQKKRRMSILSAVLFLFFIGVMDYPFLARIYNQQIQGDVIEDYESVYAEAGDEKIGRELEKARIYNEQISGSSVSIQDAFQAASDRDEEYESILDIDDSGVMAVIEIPKIGLRLPIYHGTSEAVLQKGAGHLKGSSLPVGGENTHTCISAHRGLPGKTMFTNLDQIEEGDLFFLNVLGQTLCYQVYDIETVEPEDTEALSVRAGQDLATLITCTPYGLNTHRLYIHGERIPYEEAELSDAFHGRMGLTELMTQYWWIGATILLLIWMGYMLYRINRKQEKTESGSETGEEERK